MKKCKICVNCLIRVTEDLDDNSKVIHNYFCRMLGQDPSYLLEHVEGWTRDADEMVRVVKRKLGNITNCSHFESRGKSICS